MRQSKRIGQIIRETRKTRGLTQMKLSEMIGVSYQQVQKYENGNDISVERLKQIARAFNVPMTLFFPASAENIAESQAAYEKISGEEAALLRLFRRVKSKKARKTVIELLKFLAATTAKS